jgi:hypothetical protein
MVLRETGWRVVGWVHLAQAVALAGCCEYCSKPSGNIKCWEFLEWLSNCWLLEDSAPWEFVT